VGEREQQVLEREIGMAARDRLAEGNVENRFDSRREHFRLKIED
jgi:hypothetical protein